MHMSPDDYVKKAILDTQERVRDYMNYSDQLKDQRLKSCFREFAETEGRQAEQLRNILKDMEAR